MYFNRFYVRFPGLSVQSCNKTQKLLLAVVNSAIFQYFIKQPIKRAECITKKPDISFSNQYNEIMLLRSSLKELNLFINTKIFYSANIFREKGLKSAKFVLEYCKGKGSFKYCVSQPRGGVW